MSDTHTNGHAPRVDFRRQYQRSETRRLLERYRGWDNDWSCADLWRDTRTDYFDVPGSLPSDRRGGANWPIWRTESDLDRIRQKARIVCETNPYAIGLLENLITHIVGKGFKYKFLSKENTADSDPDKAGRAAAIKQLIAKAQDEWDRFQRRNRWSGAVGPHTPLGQTREQEILRRLFRDGEVLPRYYVREGQLVVRFIEPEQLRNPLGAAYADGWAFGVQCDVKDAESVEAYHVVWIDPTLVSLASNADPEGEEIDAAEMDHLKGPRTDSTIRRGVSMFAFGVAAALERARVLGRNVSIGAQVKAAIAETWEHETGTETEVKTFASAQADHTETYTKGDGTTATRDVDVRDPGTVRRVPKGMTSVYPGPDNAAIYLQVLQADLRAACAAFAAPEYFTADASNGTYAGLKEASAPFVKFAESYQTYLGAAFARVVWRVIELAVNEGRLPREALTLLDLQVEGPTVYQRDRLQVAQESQIYNMLGVWSPQTIAMETGKDYEVEAANIEQHRERFGDMGTPLGMPGADGQMPGMPELPGLTPGGGDDAGGALHESVLEAAGTCKQGETAAKTGCVPASGDAPADDGGKAAPETPHGFDHEAVATKANAMAAAALKAGDFTRYERLDRLANVAGSYGKQREMMKKLGPKHEEYPRWQAANERTAGEVIKRLKLIGVKVPAAESVREGGEPPASPFASLVEAAGTCKQGETAKATGCVPASGDGKAHGASGGEKPDLAKTFEDHGIPLDPKGMVSEVHYSPSTSSTPPTTLAQYDPLRDRLTLVTHPSIDPKESASAAVHELSHALDYKSSGKPFKASTKDPSSELGKLAGEALAAPGFKDSLAKLGYREGEHAAEAVAYLGSRWADKKLGRAVTDNPALDALLPKFEKLLLSRAGRVRESALESACASCGPDCGCEHCKAKQGQPLLETEGVLDVPDSRQSESWSCILPGQELQGRVIGASKAWYAGEAVKIRTSGGAVLSVTSNHPVLTVMGFVAAGKLKKGQRLLHYVREDESASLGDDKQHTPAVVEEVFRSLLNVSGTILPGEVRANPFDFHGDAKGFKGNVQVVGSYGKLRSHFVPEYFQGGAEGVFVGLDVELPLKARRGGSHLGFGCASASFAGAVGSFGFCDAGIRVHPGPDNPPGLARVSDAHAVLREGPSENAVANAAVFSDNLESRTRFVQSDQFVKVGDAGTDDCQLLGSRQRRDAMLCEPAPHGRSTNPSLASQVFDTGPLLVSLNKCAEIRDRDSRPSSHQAVIFRSRAQGNTPVTKNLLNSLVTQPDRLADGGQGFSCFVSRDYAVNFGDAAAPFQDRAVVGLPPFLPVNAGAPKASRFGLASQLDIALAKDGSHSVHPDAVLAAELLQGSSGAVVSDEIVDVCRFHYEGPVYDFESPLGWIVVNRLCISNCGAAVATSIAQYFGVEPNTEPEAVLALGSSPRDGTDPEHLVSVLQGAGLETTALAGMDLEQLEWFLSKGRPVICAIQAWGDVPIQEAAGTCGVGQNPERDGCVKASGDSSVSNNQKPEEAVAAFKMSANPDENRAQIEKLSSHIEAGGDVPDKVFDTFPQPVQTMFWDDLQKNRQNAMPAPKSKYEGLPEVTWSGRETGMVYRVQPIGADLHGQKSETSAGNTIKGVFVFDNLNELAAIDWGNEKNVELLKIKASGSDLFDVGDQEGVGLKKNKGKVVARTGFADVRAAKEWMIQNQQRRGQ